MTTLRRTASSPAFRGPRLLKSVHLSFCRRNDVQHQTLRCQSTDLGSRAFQFAILIDSIRYANRFESIRLVKKSAFRFTSCRAVFSCLFIV